MMKDKRIFLLLLALMVLGWGIAVYLYLDNKNKDLYHGRIYHRQAPPFVLTDHNGDQLRLDRFRDKIVLIAWGYTNCPDICPLTLANLKEVIDSLGEDAKDVQVLFITVDPERDTAERLNSYVRRLPRLVPLASEQPPWQWSKLSPAQRQPPPFLSQAGHCGPAVAPSPKAARRPDGQIAQSKCCCCSYKYQRN